MSGGEKREALATQVRDHRSAGMGLNVLLQIALLLALLVGINVFSFHHYKRFDFSRDDSYRLSAQSRAILRDLREEITVHYLMQPNNPLLTDLTNLLKEMKSVAKDKLQINPISPYADYSSAVELQSRFQFGMRENVVIIEAGRQHMVLGVQDLAQFDTSGIEVGMKPRLEYFTGESAIIGAILATTGGEEKVVLYLTGNGQPDMESDPGMSALVSHWQRQNVRIEPFDLKVHNEIPTGAAAVIMAGPRLDLSEREATILKGYLAQRGRLLVFLSWGVDTPQLDRLISRFGIIPRGDRVLALRGTPPVYQLLRDVVAQPVLDHPAMARLGGITILIRGATQSLSLYHPTGESPTQPKPLLLALDHYWGENDQLGIEAGTPPTFDEASDTPPPVVVAAAVEESINGEGGSDRRGARLVVVGSASCLDASGITEGIQDFSTAALNWLLDQQRLSGVGPKPPRSFATNADEAALGKVSLVVMVVLPAIFALVGLGVGLMRRR